MSMTQQFVQDWGGLLGLRLVGEEPDRFSAVLAANTFLPTGLFSAYTLRINTYNLTK
jgi:pimeloyl-ACP methyl ester carboxylesterase